MNTTIIHIEVMNQLGGGGGGTGKDACIGKK